MDLLGKGCHREFGMLCLWVSCAAYGEKCLWVSCAAYGEKGMPAVLKGKNQAGKS